MMPPTAETRATRTDRARGVDRHARELAAAFPPLMVAAERVAATVAQGVHGRRRVGRGDRFWQFRPYAAGDSVRRVDWRQSAKRDRLFIREQEWEAAESVWLWRDASPSMSYGSAAGLGTKRTRAELLLLALAWLLARGGERFAPLEAGARPLTGRLAVDRMAESVGDPPAPDPRPASLPAAVPLPRHARVVLIGDFLSPLAEINRCVAGFAERGVGGHLLQTLDPAEESLPFAGRARFEGMEGEGELVVGRTESLRDAYIARLAAHRAGLKAIARAAGWTFALHHTDQAPQTALLALYGAIGQSPEPLA